MERAVHRDSGRLVVAGLLVTTSVCLPGFVGRCAALYFRHAFPQNNYDRQLWSGLSFLFFRAGGFGWGWEVAYTLEGFTPGVGSH